MYFDMNQNDSQEYFDMNQLNVLYDYMNMCQLDVLAYNSDEFAHARTRAQIFRN